MASKTQDNFKAREAIILAEMNEKRNGVRMGTLILLGICEASQDRADMFIDPAPTIEGGK